MGALGMVLLSALVGRAINPEWFFGNAEHCDTWYNVGQQILMGDAAAQQWTFARQTARVADIAVGGVFYAGLPVAAAQFLTAVFWLAVTAVALTATARRLAGPKGYWVALVLVLLCWPFYTAVATDFVNRAVVAFLALSVFGLVLSRSRPHFGPALASGAALVAFFTANSAAPAVAAIPLALIAFVVPQRRIEGLSVLRAALRVTADSLLGVAVGLVFLLALGNLTGSAPGLAVIDWTFSAGAGFIGSGNDWAAWNVPLADVFSARTLAAVFLLLSAPGAARLALWAAGNRTISAWNAEALGLHFANLGSMVLAVGMQARGAWFINEDFYLVWFLPLAVASFVVGALAYLPQRGPRRALAGIAGVGWLLFSGWALWLSPAPPLGLPSQQAVLLAFSALVFIAALVIDRSWASAMLVLFAPIVLIQLTWPTGYGGAAWRDRAAEAPAEYSGLELQEGAVAALHLFKPLAIDPTGPAVWWLENPDDLLQSRLPRASMQCPLLYREELQAAGETGFGEYSGFYVGAPRSFGQLTLGSTPVPGHRDDGLRTALTGLDVPDGQIFMATGRLEAGGSPPSWVKEAARVFESDAVTLQARGYSVVPGGNVVAAFVVGCPDGKGRCKLTYTAPRGTREE